MHERGIFESEVVECIRYPDRVLKDDTKISRFQKLFSRDTLEVVVRYKGTYFIVITAYPL